MTRVICLIALFTLTACGIDGQPLRPNAGVGINVGSGGVSAGGSIGVSQGPLRVGLGIF